MMSSRASSGGPLHRLLPRLAGLGLCCCLLWLALPRWAQAKLPDDGVPAAPGLRPEEAEATFLPLDGVSPLTLDSLSLQLAFGPSGKARAHLQADLYNPDNQAEDTQLMLVTSDGSPQVKWQGAPVATQRVMVPLPSGQGRMIPVQALRIIEMAKEKGRLEADFLLTGMPRDQDRWEFLFRLPERQLWERMGDAQVRVDTGPGLEVVGLDDTTLVQGKLQVHPFSPRGLRFLATRVGPPAWRVVYLAATAAPLAALLLVGLVARRLGLVGSMLAAGLLSLLGGWGMLRLVAYQGWLDWTTPPLAWEQMLHQLIWLGEVLGVVGGAALGWMSRSKIQLPEKEGL